MKKIVQGLLCILLLCSLFLLSSCGDDEDTPNGFQLASDPDVDGYYLYVPEDWTCNRASGIVGSYVSTLSTVKVTGAYVNTTATNMADYWEEVEPEFNDTYDTYTLLSPLDPTAQEVVQLDGHTAYLYVYEVSHEGTTYRVEQYFIETGTTFENELLTLTFVACNEENPLTGTNDYEELSKYFSKIIEEFKFSENRQVEEVDLGFQDENTPNGMKCATCQKHLGVTFYVPDAWVVTLSDGFIAAHKGQNESINLSAVDYESALDRMEVYGVEYYNEEKGFSLVDYFNILKAEYGSLMQDLEVLEEPLLAASEGETSTPATSCGESSYYTMTLHGKRLGKEFYVTLYLFHETQGSLLSQDWYLLTYMHTEASENSELEQMIKTATY